MTTTAAPAAPHTPEVAEKPAVDAPSLKSVASAGTVPASGSDSLEPLVGKPTSATKKTARKPRTVSASHTVPAPGPTEGDFSFLPSGEAPKGELKRPTW
jgi:hypothetical protein